MAGKNSQGCVMVLRTIKTLLLIKIFLIFITPQTFAADLKPLQQGKFEFDTYYTFDFSRLMSGVYKEEKLTGNGKLYLPKNLKKNDQIPIVIILHTSGGVKYNREVRYAKYLAKNGYASFIVDTYGTRKCNASGSGWKNCISKISTLDFVTDAFMAANMLSLHPNIDKSKMSLFGFSYGGDAAILSLDQDIKNIFSPNINAFNAVVSIYGACNNKFDISRTTGSNFYYIVGSEDISYDKEFCSEIRDQLETAGSKYKEFIIDGAVHGYDASFPVENISRSEIPDIFNCKFEFTKDGTVVEVTKNTTIKLNSNVPLKDKFKIRRKYIFKDIKKCYGKRSLRMGSQGFAVKKTKELFLEILQN